MFQNILISFLIYKISQFVPNNIIMHSAIWIFLYIAGYEWRKSYSLSWKVFGHFHNKSFGFTFFLFQSEKKAWCKRSISILYL